MQASQGQRIFIVEDEAVIAIDLRERLTALGYTVCGHATQGETALPTIAELRPDLVLMDVNLAGAMDGVEAARRMRADHDVPVVFLTAYADAELIARVADTASFGYLVKPFEERELHATLQVALARASAKAELEACVVERTRELREALNETEAFSYCIAHDLRAPLRAMSGYSTLIQQRHGGGLDAEAVKMLGQIDVAAQRMGKLIDGLLEFARLGRQPLRQLHIDMKRLAREAVGESLAEAGGRQIEVRVGDMPDAAGDPLLIGQVWRNLLSNAVKFTGERDRAVVEAGFDAESGAWYVRDDGAGFDMRYADKLFRPFSRLHGMREFEGIGIGLAHAARIVQRHGGRIWADAAPDKGATFYMELPRWST
jgi:light-regulated signal transduction histidine kinase (bacteriophytochrome)